MGDLSLEPWSASVVGDRLIFLGPAASASAAAAALGSGRDAHDCWSRELSGGPPIALTRTGLALWCAASVGHLVWSERADPEGLATDPERLDDPYRVRAAVLTADGVEDPLTLQEEYSQNPMVLVRGSVAVWFDPVRQVVSRDLETTDAVPEIEESLEGGGDGNGSLIGIWSGGLGFVAVASGVPSRTDGSLGTEIRTAVLPSP